MAFQPTQGFIVPDVGPLIGHAAYMSVPRHSSICICADGWLVHLKLGKRKCRAKAEFYKPVLFVAPGLVLCLREEFKEYGWNSSLDTQSETITNRKSSKVADRVATKDRPEFILQHF